MANYLKTGQNLTHYARGSHNFPRYIYHLTNKKNYDAIVTSGKIIPSVDILCGKGIFATDLTNFFKFWRKNKAWDGESLQRKLVEHVTKGNSNIVVLRIPTAALNKDILKIRSQNRGFTLMDTKDAKKFFKNFSNKINKIIFDLHDSDKWEAFATDYINKNLPDSLTDLKGFPAKYSKLFKQRKEAIEFIYPREIPLQYCEKIGEVNLDKLGKNPSIRKIFTTLLKGTPEYNGAKLLNC